jgi:hypothetical protein
MRTASTNSSIGSLYLRPSLFDEHDPDLLFCGFAENWSVCLGENGYEVINYHLARNSFVVNDEFIDTLRTNVKIFVKNSRNSFFQLGQGSDRGQEVAVTDVSLANVRRGKLILNHYAILDDFTGSLPSERSAFDFEIQAFLVG